MIVYIGNNTLIILACHRLAFKLISICKIQIYSLDDTLLQQNVIEAYNTYWWIGYSIIGVTLPVMGKKIYFNMKDRLN